MLNLKEDYLKQKTYLKGWLLGKGYFKALKAMEFAQLHHNGKRKDGQEEFSHQVSQACYAITLSDYLLYPEDGYLTISNALQWRLQYQRIVTLTDEVKGITKIVSYNKPQ